MTYSDISPAESTAYENRRRRARDTYEGGLAALESQRGDVMAKQGLDTAQFTRNWDQSRNRLPGGYARRGLLNSGIYKRGLEQYAQARQQASSQLGLRYQAMLNQMNQQQMAAGLQFNNTMGDLYDQEAMRRAEIAAALKGL